MSTQLEMLRKTNKIQLTFVDLFFIIEISRKLIRVKQFSKTIFSKYWPSSRIMEEQINFHHLFSDIEVFPQMSYPLKSSFQSVQNTIFHMYSCFPILTYLSQTHLDFYFCNIRHKSPRLRQYLIMNTISQTVVIYLFYHRTLVSKLAETVIKIFINIKEP